MRLKDHIPADQEDAVGVLVKELISRSTAAQLGFEKGDIIYGVNRTRVRNLNDLRDAVHYQRVTKFLIQRGYLELAIYLR